MKQREGKTRIRWLDLTCAVIWLINLAARLSDYLQLLDRGAPPERLADARFSCVIAGFVAVMWLISCFVWRMDQKTPAARLVRLIFPAAALAGWAVTYPLATASGYPPFFWWTILAVLAGVTIYGVWNYFALKRKMRSSEEDEMI